MCLQMVACGHHVLVNRVATNTDRVHSTKMQLFSWISCLLFATVVLAIDTPLELKIETTFMPRDCPAKATKGDAIKVHYVSIFLTETGTPLLSLILGDRQENSSQMARNLTPGMSILECYITISNDSRTVLTVEPHCL